MKVQLERTFPVAAPADAAWALLQDIEKVAACMPGARITERVDATHYKGMVAVKFGPASMSFRGELEVLSLDVAQRTLHMLGKGTDSTGGSGASMDLVARIEAVDAASCNLVGKSEVSMSGKAAAFGGRMATSVADQVLKQFAANFDADTKVVATTRVSAPAPSSGGADAEPVSGAPTGPRARQLSGLALAWTVFKEWLRGLFAAKQT